MFISVCGGCVYFIYIQNKCLYNIYTILYIHKIFPVAYALHLRDFLLSHMKVFWKPKFSKIILLYVNVKLEPLRVKGKCTTSLYPFRITKVFSSFWFVIQKWTEASPSYLSFWSSYYINHGLGICSTGGWRTLDMLFPLYHLSMGMGFCVTYIKYNKVLKVLKMALLNECVGNWKCTRVVSPNCLGCNLINFRITFHNCRINASI